MTHHTDLAHARERLSELDREPAGLLAAIATLERDYGGADITTAAGRVALFTALLRERPSWQDDVGAPLDAAAELNGPVLVERSRSGDGTHVCILFSRPVSALDARAVGHCC